MRAGIHAATQARAAASVASIPRAVNAPYTIMPMNAAMPACAASAATGAGRSGEIAASAAAGAISPSRRGTLSASVRRKAVPAQP